MATTPIVVSSISKRRSPKKFSLLSLVAVGLGILLSLSFGFGSNVGLAQAAAQATAPSYHYFSFEVEVKLKPQTAAAGGSPALSQGQVQELANTIARWRLEFRADNRSLAGKLLPVSSTENNPGFYRLLNRLEPTQKSGQLVLVDSAGAIVGSQQLDWNSPGDYSLTGSFILRITGDGTSGAAEFDKTSYKLKTSLHTWASSLVSELSTQEATSNLLTPTVATTAKVTTTKTSSSGSPVTDEAASSTSSTPRTVRRGGNPVLLVILTLLFWGLCTVLLIHAFQVGLFRLSLKTSSGSSSVLLTKDKEKEKVKEKKPFSFGLGSSQKSRSNFASAQASAELVGSNGAVAQPEPEPEPEISQASNRNPATPVSLLGEMDEIQMPDQALFGVTAMSAGNPKVRESASVQLHAKAEGNGPTLVKSEIDIEVVATNIELGQEGGQVGKPGSILAPVWNCQGEDEPGRQPEETSSVRGSGESTVLFVGNLKKLDSQFEHDALTLLVQDNAACRWLAADKVTIQNQVYLKDLAKTLWSTTGSTGFGSAESAFMGNDSRLDFLLKVERTGYPARLVAIETDGPQHFSDDAQRRRDVKKNRILEKLDIPLIRVSHVRQLQGRVEALPSVLWGGASAPVHPSIFIKLDPSVKSKFPFNFSFKSATRAKTKQSHSKPKKNKTRTRS